MMLGTFYGIAIINSALTLPGKLFVTEERIDISTAGPRLDRNWTFVDAAGHFHAVSNGELPTLAARSAHRECDGSCGGVCGGAGYDVTQYFCRICDELVKPGMVPGPHFETMPGRSDWRAELEGFAVGDLLPVDHRAAVSMRFDAKGPVERTFFGPAMLGDMEVSGGLGDLPFLKVNLHAAGELGDRPLMKETVVPAT